MGFGLISPILPIYARSFDVSILMVGLLVLDVPMGRLSDRFGRRPLVIIGPALMCVGSLAGALSDNFWQLLAARVMWGLGSAVGLMSLQVMLTDITTVSNRGRVMSLYHGAFQVGVGLGPAIGGFIAFYYGLKAPFFAYSAVAFVATLWAFLRLRETRKPIAEAAETKEGSSRATGSRPQEKSLPLMKKLFLDTSFMLVAFMALAYAISRVGTFEMMLPILASEQIGINTGQLGMAMTIISVVHVATIFPGGWISDHFGRKKALVPGHLIVALGMVIFALSQNYWVFLSGAVIMGLGRGISGPTIAYAADLASEGQYGRTLGFYHTFTDTGVTIGPLILGWLADNQGLSAPFYFNVVLLTLVTLLFGLFARETVPSNKQQ
jgi:MFS family permease